MNFGLSDEQEEIKRIAHALLEQRSGFGQVRAAAEQGAYDPRLWREMGGLGWPGIAVEERFGGLGLGYVEAAVLVEEAGAALAGSPLLATLAAAAVLGEAGSKEQRAAWLPRLASGAASGALGFVAEGVAVPVPDAAGADLVVLTEGGHASLFVPAELTVAPFETIDPTRRYARVSAAPGSGEPLPGDPSPALDGVAVLLAAELLGVSDRALAMTVAYVKERRQFGTPIGAFQAVAHRCAEMLVATEGARSATYYAAWAADAEPDQRVRAAALAAATAAEAAREVTAAAIQA
ncbi:MAG TPA: acyl-CoA dehydrogenase family protein, partial [Solirubrobacterales bacterium]